MTTCLAVLFASNEKYVNSLLRTEEVMIEVNELSPLIVISEKFLKYIHIIQDHRL